MSVLTDQMKAEGWIGHDGGLCPLEDGGLVRVILRSGLETFSRFGFWVWDERAPLNIDIVAYRPAAPEQARLAA